MLFYISHLPYEKTVLIMKRTYLQLPAAVLVAACLFPVRRICQTNLVHPGKTHYQTQLLPNLNFPVVSTARKHRGGWGSNPAGNNPGAYLHANFNAAFGDSLTVGCVGSNFYIKLTSAQAVTNLLPVGGKPSAIKANANDPASLNNVLVGQLVALKLSVGFDIYDLILVVLMLN